MNQGMQAALRSWIIQGNGFALELPEGTQLISNFWPTELKDNTLVFSATEFVVVYYSSNRKSTYQLCHPWSSDLHLHL